MEHKWDYQCRCAKCITFEVALRMQLKLDEKRRKENTVTCQQVEEHR